MSQSGSRMSREDMLRELELLPVWQLRQPLPPQAAIVDTSYTEQKRSEVETVLEPVLENIQPQPIRLLLSEDSTYAFLMQTGVTAGDAQAVEILFTNMIRAMQVSCRMDVTDTADNVFAVHTPKLIISMGAEPANLLLGETRSLAEWRNIQQENQPFYKTIPLMVTYHPAHLLKNTADKAHAWRDLCAAMKLLQRL